MRNDNATKSGSPDHLEKRVKYWRLISPSIAYWSTYLFGKNIVPFDITPDLVFNCWPIVALLSIFWEATYQGRKRQTVKFITKIWMLIHGKIPPVIGGDYSTKRSTITIVHCDVDDICREIDQQVTAQIDAINIASKQDQQLHISDDADGLLIIRNKRMEEHAMFGKNILEPINDWARRNSETACLVIEGEDGIKGSNFNNFYSISRGHLTEINQYLIKRTNERAGIWRKQAQFNRAMFLACFVGLIGCYISLSVVNSISSARYLTTTEKTFELALNYHCVHDLVQQDKFKHVLANYLSFHQQNLQDEFGLEDIHITTYYHHNDSAINFVTTDENTTRGRWAINTGSITGCSFYRPYHFILYRKSDNGLVFFLGKDGRIADLRAIDCKFDSSSPTSPETILHYSRPTTDRSTIIGLGLYSRTPQDFSNQQVFDYLKKMVNTLSQLQWQCPADTQLTKVP